MTNLTCKASGNKALADRYGLKLYEAANGNSLIKGCNGNWYIKC